MFQKLIPVYLVNNLEQLLPVSGNHGATLRELMLLNDMFFILSNDMFDMFFTFPIEQHL